LNAVNSVMKVAIISGSEVLTGPILVGLYNLTK